MKILLADDESSIQFLYRELLEGSGHQVATAGDGEQVLQMLGEEAFDLVVLDLNMPKVDGFQAMEEMKKRKIEVPVIVMTGYYPDDEVRRRTANLDVVEFLRKPVMITTMLNAVNRAISNAKAQ